MNYIKEHWNYLNQPGAYPGIDILRALAVTVVVLFHLELLYFGWVGVDLFFVISGFLIGGIIIDKIMREKFSFIEFYRRRALRILPVYYTMIILCAIFKSSTPIDWIAVKTIISGMLFLQTTGPYFFPEFFKLNNAYIVGGSWTLVIEEMFYLLAPLILIVFIKICKKKLLLVACLVGALVLSGILTRSYMVSAFAPNDPNWHYASFIQFHSRYDELAAGILAALLVRIDHNMKSRAGWWMTAAILLIATFLIYIYSNPEFIAKPQTITRDTIWLPTLLAGAGMSLLLCSYWRECNMPLIIVLARLSYPLYLVHILFIELLKHFSKDGIMLWMLKYFTFEGRAIILIALSILLSYLVSLLIEYPFIRSYKNKTVDV